MGIRSPDVHDVWFGAVGSRRVWTRWKKTIGLIWCFALLYGVLLIQTVMGSCGRVACS